jgi:ABC-type multidrug transport system permease subunit
MNHNVKAFLWTVTVPVLSLSIIGVGWLIENYFNAAILAGLSIFGTAFFTIIYLEIRELIKKNEKGNNVS